VTLVFVDCEAEGPCPAMGHLTEFGAVTYPKKQKFHGVLWESELDPENPARRRRTGQQFPAVPVFTNFAVWLRQHAPGPVLVSDNPAYDWQWINHGFWTTLGRNPFGHSARRISDFYAGLVGDFSQSQKWKRLRVTKHDHHPVHDALGNVEAFERMLKGER
jgi:hypothetical protein